MKIAVTGATGFIGSHIAQGMLDDGHEISLLVRSRGKLIPALQSCRVVEGDLLEVNSLKEAFAGADAVVHCAAHVGEWGSREDYFQTNVTGTRNVVDACVAAGVKRLIHFSSNSVYGDGSGDHVEVTEDTPYQSGWHPYGDSKIEGERLVFEAHQAGKIVATAIRPGMVWGPRDRQFLPKIIDALSKGMMVYLGGGSKLFGLTHVDNLVDVVRRSLARKTSHGRAYNVDDDDRRTLRDLVRALCVRLGYKEPWLTIPANVAKVLATVSEFVWLAVGAKKPPLITKMGVSILCYDNDVSVERAKKELGYDPQDRFDERLDAYLKSYRAKE